MHPILFQLGAITVYTYGVLVATGVILALWYARRQAVRVGLPPREIWNLGIYMIFAALIVSKLWLILSGWSYYATNPSEIFSVATLESAGTNVNEWSRRSSVYLCCPCSTSLRTSKISASV